MNLLTNRTVVCVLACLFSANACSEVVNYLVVEDISKPFQITENNVSKGGIVSDIVDEIFKDSKYTIKRHILPLKRLYKVIESGEMTNWIAYDAKAWNSLSQWGTFIDEPLFPVNHAYLTCQKNGPTKITSTKDIETHNLAIIRNFDYPELNKLEKAGKLSLSPVDDYQQGISLAGLNRVDGFIEMELRLRFSIQQEKLNKPCFQFIDMSKVIPEYSIYLSIDKNNVSGLSEFALQRINKLKKTHSIDDILHRYTKQSL